MTDRQRFVNTLLFKPIDRPFRWEMPAAWHATLVRWANEGMPEKLVQDDILHRSIFEYFGMDRLEWLPFGTWVNEPFVPPFEVRQLAEDEKTITIRDFDGITKRIFKMNADTSMPQFLDFPVKNAKDYKNNIQWRFCPGNSQRYPDHWSELLEGYNQRTYPLGLFVTGPFGHLRNLFGDENLMYAFFDNPKLVEEIMEHWTFFYCEFIKELSIQVSPDFIMVWEDNCYKNGPLISPDLYRSFLSSSLEKVIAYARETGIKCFIVDTDGDCRKMIPVYLDCGINAFYPFEVQAGMDIVEIRKKYKKHCAIIGGLDKRAMEIGEKEIKYEIDKKVPFLLGDGGYIPMADHGIPASVSLSNFRFFVQYIRQLVLN